MILGYIIILSLIMIPVYTTTMLLPMNTFDSEYPFGDFLEYSKFDELCEFLQFHFQKKNNFNIMGESNIPMHALIFWCGWETKSIHNILSYIFTSLSNDMICGKTISHWFFKQSNEIYGGTPPSLYNIKTEPELVNFFVDYLFVQRTHIPHKTKFKRIFDATVLILHDAFLGIIGNEPSGKYKDPTHHHFHHKIISVPADTYISIEIFHKWQNGVISGFNENNWLVVDVAKVGQGSAKRYVDSRCVVGVIDEQGEAIGRLQ